MANEIGARVLGPYGTFTIKMAAGLGNEPFAIIDVDGAKVFVIDTSGNFVFRGIMAQQDNMGTTD